MLSQPSLETCVVHVCSPVKSALLIGCCLSMSSLFPQCSCRCFISAHVMLIYHSKTESNHICPVTWSHPLSLNLVIELVQSSLNLLYFIPFDCGNQAGHANFKEQFQELAITHCQHTLAGSLHSTYIF